MLSIIFAGIIITSSATFGTRANLKPWNWKKYKVKFKLPGYWTVKDKGGRSGKFTASGYGASFRLKPWRDRSRTAKQVAMAAYRSSTSIKRKRIISQRSMTTKRGLRKYMILTSGYQKGKKVKIGIMGFINPRSPVNLYARFFWWAGGKYVKGNNKVTYKVAQSFAATR